MFAGITVRWEPQKAFGSFKEQPKWLAPFLLVVGVGIATTAFHFLRIDVSEALLETMAASMPEGQEGELDKMEGMIGVIAAFTTVMAFVTPIVRLLVVGFLAWLISKIFAGEGGFKDGLGVAAMASMPLVLAGIISVPIALGHAEPPDFEGMQTLIKSHPAAWLGLETTNPFFAASAQFGLFQLGALALLVVGPARVMAVPATKAAMVFVGIKIALASMAVMGAMAGQLAQQVG